MLADRAMLADMPQCQLSPTDWALVVRTICDVQHLLTVLNGFRVVEAGVDLAEADEATTTTLNTGDDVQALERALRLLGFDSAVDPMPPQVRDQLADLFGYPRPPR
jgi:hypothetical protein